MNRPWRYASVERELRVIESNELGDDAHESAVAVRLGRERVEGD